MKTISEWAWMQGIRLTKCERTDRNPHMDNSDDMDHWRVTLARGKRGVDYRELTLTFSMGRGHGGAKPDAADILDCLASDAAAVENAQDFAEWCAELGFSDNSRKAERTYNVCLQQAARLRRFMGSDYDALLYEAERL